LSIEQALSAYQLTSESAPGSSLEPNNPRNLRNLRKSCDTRSTDYTDYADWSSHLVGMGFIFLICGNLRNLRIVFALSSSFLLTQQHIS
jgi:hypothetical protein